MTGTGTLQVNELINGGTITVGSVANPQGTLRVDPSPVPGSGNFRQLASGTLNLKLFGAPATNQYIRLIVSARASLGGTVTVSPIGGYIPAQNDAFDLIFWGELDPNADVFATVPQGWTPSYQNGFRLTKN